jgi:hypothetical protein
LIECSFTQPIERRLTKNQIIEQLFLSKEFNDCINKMQPADLRDDLKSEVMLILLEKDEAEIKDLHSQNKLKFYTVRIILNQIQSNTSPFYKKFRSINKQIFENSGLNKILESEHLDETKAHQDQLVKYLDKLNHDPAHDELHERLVKEMKEDKAIDFINAMPEGDYDKEIVKLYLQLGNYRAIEDETSVNGMPGIPWESCYSTIQKVIKRIRDHVES